MSFPIFRFKYRLSGKNRNEWKHRILRASDQFWWLHTFEWLLRTWADVDNVARFDTPVFYAHIFRYRNRTEIARLIAYRTGEFLTEPQQATICSAVSNYDYRTDNFRSFVVSALSNQYCTKYTLSDGTESTDAATCAIDVLSEYDMVIHPNPLTDVTSVSLTIYKKGSFNALSPVAGFNAINIDPRTCMLERPFADNHSLTGDTFGYNLILEPAPNNGAFPFASSGSYTVKIIVTPTHGNPIVLSYDLKVN